MKFHLSRANLISKFKKIFVQNKLKNIVVYLFISNFQIKIDFLKFLSKFNKNKTFHFFQMFNKD